MEDHRRRIRPVGRAKPAAIAVLAALVGTFLAACGSDTGSSSPSTSATDAKIGFIFVGRKDDYGYNQAAYQGSHEVAQAFPKNKVIIQEDVPETDQAAQVMEQMIGDGARLIFATSYGHKDAALKVARNHPEVVVVHQGGLVDGTMPDNFGTYFGTVYEPVYLAGIVAGLTTKTNKLGYVYAFPIPQTRDDVDAFHLGAKSVNPAVKTITVSTANWCDPAKQREAARTLLDQGVDVITQHQGCTGMIIKATEEAGKFSVGSHVNASALAPKGWLTGSEWRWGPLYTKIVRKILDGKFKGSEFNANYRAGYKTGDSPFVQSDYGPSVADDMKKKVDEAKAKISKDGSPFTGPVVDNKGVTRIPAGTVPDYRTIESIDYFVDGVTG